MSTLTHCPCKVDYLVFTLLSVDLYICTCTECMHFKKRIKRPISPRIQYSILVVKLLALKPSCMPSTLVTLLAVLPPNNNYTTRTAVLPYLAWNGLGITYSLLADVLASTHIHWVYTTLSSLSLSHYLWQRCLPPLLVLQTVNTIRCPFLHWGLQHTAVCQASF